MCTDGTCHVLGRFHFHQQCQLYLQSVGRAAHGLFSSDALFVTNARNILLLLQLLLIIRKILGFCIPKPSSPVPYTTNGIPNHTFDFIYLFQDFNQYCIIYSLLIESQHGCRQCGGESFSYWINLQNQEYEDMSFWINLQKSRCRYPNYYYYY